MVDGNENYKFDLGVRVKVPKKDLSHAIPKITPRALQRASLIKNWIFPTTSSKKARKMLLCMNRCKKHRGK